MQPILPTHKNTSLNKLISDLDYSGHDSGLDTPPSTHRPSSYREQPQRNIHAQASPRDSTETSVSSSRGTMLNSPGSSFRTKQVSKQGQKVLKLNQVNALQGSRYSVQERVLKIRNEEEHCISNKSTNTINQNEMYDPNQNRYYKSDNQPAKSMKPQHTPTKMQHFHQTHHQYQSANGNGNGNTVNNNNNNAINGNVQNGSAIFRERYQHPALAAIIKDAQGIKFRGTLKHNGERYI